MYLYTLYAVYEVAKRYAHGIYALSAREMGSFRIMIGHELKDERGRVREQV